MKGHHDDGGNVEIEGWDVDEIKDEFVVLSDFNKILTEFKYKNVTCVNWKNEKNLCMHPL